MCLARERCSGERSRLMTIAAVRRPSSCSAMGMWERQFGGQRSVLGQRVELNGTRYTVVGVMPRGFEYPRGSEAWIALVPAIDSLVDNPRIAFLNIVGRVRPGVSVEGARQDAERLLARSVAAAGLSNTVSGVV